MDAFTPYLMPLVYALLVLQALDLATTLYVLRTGKGAEANPILSKLFELVEPLVVLLTLKGVFAVGIWMYKDSFAIEALWAVTALYVAVIINNVRLIRKAAHE